MKLIEYFASAVNFVSSNPYVGPLQRIKTSFPLLSTCPVELLSAPKIMTLLPKLSSVNKNSEWESKPIP